jgi:hypothetical protein
MSSDESSSDSSELARSGSEATSTSTRTTPSTSTQSMTTTTTSKATEVKQATFFNASVSEASGVAGGEAGAQVYMQKSAFKSLSTVSKFANRSSPIRSRRAATGSTSSKMRASVCLTASLQRVTCLFNCRFAPQSLDVRYKRVVVCGNGDQFAVADAYTGRRHLSIAAQNGRHLTNVARLFCSAHPSAPVSASILTILPIDLPCTTTTTTTTTMMMLRRR